MNIPRIGDFRYCWGLIRLRMSPGFANSMAVWLVTAAVERPSSTRLRLRLLVLKRSRAYLESFRQSSIHISKFLCRIVETASERWLVADAEPRFVRAARRQTGFQLPGA